MRVTCAHDQHAEPPVGAGETPASELAAAALADGLGRFDRELAHEAIARLLGAATFETVASRVLLPYLADGGSARADEQVVLRLLRRLARPPGVLRAG